MRCPLSGEDALLAFSIPVETILAAYKNLEHFTGPLDLPRFFSAVDQVDV